MSLYGDYLKERTNDCIIEDDTGFVTYRILSETKSAYIIDIFVRPESRCLYNATIMADKVVKAAKQLGCTELLGSVVPSSKGSTTSLKVLLGYGMHLKSSSQDFIIFSKEI